MQLDLTSTFSGLLTPVFSFAGNFLTFVFSTSIALILSFFGYFFIRYRVNLFRLDADYLRNLFIRYKYYNLLRWLLVDWLGRKDKLGEFREYGFTFFVGRQGAGKTMSMVEYLDRLKRRYPDCMIVTNFKYDQADFIMCDWRDILNVRNGENGVIFAIDEIHSEYSASSWKDVPETLLSEISQQRKQYVKIVATAQFFSRIAKPLREQANDVIVCKTAFGRLTSTRRYDSIDYATVIDNPNIVKRRLRPLSKHSFVQSDSLRECYDTYEKIERMQKIEFIPRHQRNGV